MSIRIQGKNSKTAFFLTLLFCLQILSGCSGEIADDDPEIIGCMDQGAINFNPDATIGDEPSCEYEELSLIHI